MILFIPDLKRMFSVAFVLLMICCFTPAIAQTEWEEEYDEEPYSDRTIKASKEEDLYNRGYKRKTRAYEEDREFSGRLGAGLSTRESKELQKTEKTESTDNTGFSPGDETNPTDETGSPYSPKEEDMQAPPPPPTEPNIPVSDAVPLVIVSGIGYAIWKLRRSAA